MSSDKPSTRRAYSIDPKIVIKRDLKAGSYRFLEIFTGFDTLLAVREIFGKNTHSTLANLNVELFSRQGFMGVSDEDGHIFASLPYTGVSGVLAATENSPGSN